MTRRKPKGRELKIKRDRENTVRERRSDNEISTINMIVDIENNEADYNANKVDLKERSSFKEYGNYKGGVEGKWCSD